MTKPNKIRVSIYNFDIFLYVCNYDEYRESILKKFKYDLGDDLAYGAEHLAMEDINGNRFSIIRINEYNDTPEYYTTIFHESIHCAMFILGRVGVVVTEENHEALTYLVDFIALEIIKIAKSKK